MLIFYPVGWARRSLLPLQECLPSNSISTRTL
jgi:hypothetical protein